MAQTSHTADDLAIHRFSPVVASADEASKDQPTEPPRRERAEALGTEMVKLTAHLSAAEARFLEMLAEFDRDQLWLCFGCHCAAQWLTWQCGLGDVAARERVRVARALEKLPKISAAFRCGEISYSKVREMTRIAIPEMEESLLNIARHGTAAHMQRLVRKYRRVERAEAAAEALEQYRRRYVHYRHEDDGMLVIEARLPIEIGEIVMKAIDAAVEVLYQDGVRKNRDDDVPAGTSELPAETSELDSAERSADANLVGSNAGGGDATPADAKAPNEAEAQNEAEAEAACASAASHSHEIEPADVPAGTLGAAERGAVLSDSGAEDDDYTSPLWQPHEMPGGDAVIEEFEGESWPGSLGARRADGLRLLAERYLAAGADRVDTSAERYQVVVHIDQALLASESVASATGGRLPQSSSGRLFQTCELGDGHSLAIETARRLACDTSLVGIVNDENGEPLNVGRKTRAISPALRRALRARDGGCRFPGCGRTRFTHAHHVIHWANGGETKLENLITLCHFHHGLVHEGGFSIERIGDGGFALFSPNGERLPESGRLDWVTIALLRDAAERGHVTLHELNRGSGLEIDESTARCLWTGERMDYHMAVGGLIWTRDRAREGVRDCAVTH